ncbi:MAG: hypothetical protein ACYTAN_16335, partial [Planctomycetota bacterium]
MKLHRRWKLAAVFVLVVLLSWPIHSMMAPSGRIRLRLLNHITAAKRNILWETRIALERSASQNDQRAVFSDADELQTLASQRTWGFNVGNVLCRLRIPNDGVAQKGTGLRAELASRLVPVPVWPVNQP